LRASSHAVAPHTPSMSALTNTFTTGDASGEGSAESRF
jgi:hypothetical protein